MTDVVVPADAQGKHTDHADGRRHSEDDRHRRRHPRVPRRCPERRRAPASRPPPLKLDGGAYRLNVQSATTGAANTVTLTAVRRQRPARRRNRRGRSRRRDHDRRGHPALGDEHVQGRRYPASTSPSPRRPSGQHGRRRPSSRDTAAASTQAKALVDAVNSRPGRHRDPDEVQLHHQDVRRAGRRRDRPRASGTSLLDSIYPGDGTTLADIGIQTDRYGKLVFDEEKFADGVRRRRRRRHREAERGHGPRRADRGGRERRQRQVRGLDHDHRSRAAPPASTASTTASRPGTSASSCVARR